MPILLIFTLMVFSISCTPSERKSVAFSELTDELVTLTLQKSEVASNTEHNLGIINAAGAAAAPSPVAVVAILVTLVIGPVVNKVFIGSIVYVYPEGYMESHRQELAWGSNDIFLPKDFISNGGNLVFEVEGGREGVWTKQYDPSNPNIVIKNGI